MLGSLASSRSSVLLAAPTAPSRAGTASGLAKQLSGHSWCLAASALMSLCFYAGRTFVAAVECKQLSRKESTRKRHLRIRKKVG